MGRARYQITAMSEGFYTDTWRTTQMDKAPIEQPGAEFLTSGRIVLDRREGNRVFVRTLRPDEEDTREGVNIRAGDQLIFEAGALVIDSKEIDAQSVKGRGGYAPVANTVWTWYRIVGEQLGFFLFFFSLARRIDAAHALWTLAVQEREKAKEEGAISQRTGFLNALATAEVTIIALHRAIAMVYSLTDKFCPNLEVPNNVQGIRDAVWEMRNAFEHIDERAEGRVGRSKEMQSDALTIFDQPDFIESSILSYKTYSLNFDEDVLSALLECRELVMNAIDSRAAPHADRKMVDEA